MIRLIDFQVRVEKHDTHEAYYPRVVDFDTKDSYEFTNAPSSTITIQGTSNLNEASSASLIETDDIIRLRVAIRSNEAENVVWVDIFEGRVQNQKLKYGTNDNIELECVGHITEVFDKVITVGNTFTNIDAKDVLSSVASTYLKRISYDANYINSGVAIQEYNTTAYQITVSDVFKELEKISGYTWMIDVLPYYFTEGNLNKCYLRWRRRPTVTTKRYAVIEGTPRLISANFTVYGEDIKNYIYVKGGTDDSGNSYTGSAYDQTSIDVHGIRAKVETYTWVKSSSLCTQIAAGDVIDQKNPYVSGQVVLMGTPDAQKGDLVRVKIPSLAIVEKFIDGNYTVSAVNNRYSEGIYTTTIDLGKIQKNEYDYINTRLTQVLQDTYKNTIASGTVSGSSGGSGTGEQYPSNTSTDTSSISSSTKNSIIQMTTCNENSTIVPQWNYAENLGDNRGITFGCIGFCTGTYDGNILIKYYTTLNSSNILAKYISALNTIDAGAHNYNDGDSNPSVVGLNGFIKDVENCTDSLFKTAQLYELDQMYYNPAVKIYNNIGAKYPITLAFIYDMCIRHGEDEAQDIVDAAGSTPKQGTDEKAFLKKMISLRTTKLKSEGIGDEDRCVGYTNLINSGNLTLKTPFTYVAYGDSFTITGVIST